MLRSALVKLALALAAVFAGLSLLGGRDAVGVLSGTLTTASDALLGVGYALSYFLALLLGPPLLATGWLRALGNRARAAPKPPTPASRGGGFALL